MRWYVNQDILKIGALVLMTIEHIASIGYGVKTGWPILLGRMAYPIFAWLIALHLTHNVGFVKYLKRLFVFGIITFVALLPFGVYDTLLWSFMVPVACIGIWEEIEGKSFSKTVKFWMKSGIFVCGIFVSLFLYYSCFGFFYILAAYSVIRHYSIIKAFLSICMGFLLNPTLVLFATVSAVTTVFLIKVKKSSHRFLAYKYAFYIYYPAHLVILHILKSIGVFG